LTEFSSLDELYAAADAEKARRPRPATQASRATPDRGSAGGGHHWGNLGNTRADQERRSFWDSLRATQADPKFQQNIDRMMPNEINTARAVVGGVRDAFQGFMDSVDDLAEAADNFVYTRTGIGTYITLGREADNGIVGLVSKAEAERRTGRAAGFGVLQDIRTPKVAGAGVARDVVEFGTSFATGMRATKFIAAAGNTARVAPAIAAGFRGLQSTTAGAYAAFVDHAPMEGNLVNMAASLGIPQPALLEALAVDEADGALEARLKNAAVDFVAGPLFDGAVATLAGAVKGFKALRGINEDLDAILGVPEEIMKVDPKAARRVADEGITVETPDGVVHDVPRVPKGTDELPEVSPREPGTVGPLDDNMTEGFQALPQRTRAKIAKLSDAEKKALADDILSGNPARQVEIDERLGLHPNRVDVTNALLKDETGEAVIDVIVKTADAIEELSQSYGSATRGWNEAQALGNILGVHGKRVVEVFQSKTKNLDAFAMVARKTVENSSVDLMRLAERAKGFADAPERPEWIEFMAALDTHAVLHATLKGATSNMGRGLASLRATVNASKGSKARLKTLAGTAENTPVDDAMEAYRKLVGQTSVAGRRALVDKVLRSRGDLPTLGKLADAGTNPRAFRRAVREYLVNSLWSVGTAKATVVGTVLHGSARIAARTIMHGQGLIFAGKRGQAYAIERAADAAYTAAMFKSLGTGLGRTLHLLADTTLHEGRLIAGAAHPAAGKAVKKVHDALNDAVGPFRPTTARPEFERETAFAIQPETIDALMESADQLPAVMRMGYRGLLGVMGVGVNALGATGRGVRALTIEAADELFGSISTQAHRAANASRQAMAEGYARGLKGKELENWVTARSKAYFDNESEELLEQIEAQIAAGADPNAPELVDAAQRALARMEIEDATSATVSQLMLQDHLQTGLAQGVSKGLRSVDSLFGDVGLLFPIVHTPLRGLEVAFKDFTPLGLLSREMRDRLYSGGPDASVVMAQMALGTTLIGWAATEAMSGNIVGYDGGPKSSTRLTRPQYSIRIGDKWHEYNRYDPMTMHLGLASDIVEVMRGVDLEARDEPGPMLVKAASAMALAFSRNVTSRTFMRSVEDYAAILSDTEGSRAEAALTRLITSTAGRAVPMSGVGKWWEGEDSDATREAVTMWEKALRNSGWFQDSLPVRVDPLLGRPIAYDRDLGVNTTTVTEDRLLNEMSAIAFSISQQSKTLKGVDLTAEQLSRVAVIRAQEAVDDSGRTMTETLQDLIVDPEWAEMNQGTRERAVRKIRDRYNRLVPDLLAEEDPEFAYQLARKEEHKYLTEELGLEGPALWTELERFGRDERRLRGLPAEERDKFAAIFNLN
jgi:hypothetical protein